MFFLDNSLYCRKEKVHTIIMIYFFGRVGGGFGLITHLAMIERTSARIPSNLPIAEKGSGVFDQWQTEDPNCSTNSRNDS